jgi:hypothetical protein
MRLIEQLGVVMARVLALKQNNQAHEALKEIEQACEKYLGLDPRVIEAASGDALIGLMSMGGKFDPKRAVLLGELLREEGDLYNMEGMADRGYWSFTRSLWLLVESLNRDPELRTPENIEDTRFVVSRLSRYELSPELKSRLFIYYEWRREFDKAENILFDLLDRDRATWSAKGVEFYKRLSALTDDELAAGGLPREEIKQGMREVNERVKPKKSRVKK